MSICKSTIGILIGLVALVPTWLGPAGAPRAKATVAGPEWTDIRYAEVAEVELAGQWIGENSVVLSSEEVNAEGDLVLEFDRLERRRFVALPSDAEAVFATGHSTDREIPTCCRMAMRIEPLGEVTAVNDYRELESLASPSGEACALNSRKKGPTDLEREQDVTTPRQVRTKAVFVTSFETLEYYEAAPGTLTLLRDRARLDVPEELRDDYGLLMARRDDGSLYFWLVPR